VTTLAGVMSNRDDPTEALEAKLQRHFPTHHLEAAGTVVSRHRAETGPASTLLHPEVHWTTAVEEHFHGPTS
jgi:hypothetical protein